MDAAFEFLDPAFDLVSHTMAANDTSHAQRGEDGVYGCAVSSI